jgi:hypothetical protein
MSERIWYELVHEANEEGESYLGPTVLYTSHDGLKALAESLQAVSSSGQAGRFSLEVLSNCEDCHAPFSHIEIADEPPAEIYKTEKGSRALYWFIGVVVAIPLFALYGLVRLAMDLLQ